MSGPGSKSRMEQYKNSGRAKTFRDQLKKRCLDRLRSTRMDKFNSRREIEVEEIIRETAEAVKTEMGTFELDEVNWMLEIYEDIQSSLLREQYEDIIQTEQDRLNCEVSEYLDPSVFCPSCTKFPMTITSTAAECQGCPFHFRFKDGCSSPSPSQLNKSLTSGFGEHEATLCAYMPEPYVKDSSLYLQCKYCSFYTKILE